MPDRDPELYAAERGATGVRGSYLAYRPDVFHRAVDLTEPGGARFLLNASYKLAGQDWVGYHTMQSRATSPHWVSFRRRIDTRGVGTLRVPRSGPPHLECGAPRRHGASLSQARSLSLGLGARRLTDAAAGRAQMNLTSSTATTTHTPATSTAGTVSRCRDDNKMMQLNT